MVRIALATAGVIAIGAVLLLLWTDRRDTDPWTAHELSIIRSLSIENLRALPPDPTNLVADSLAAARFGQALFFDPRLSGNGRVSCSTCHQPERYFTDGLPVSTGVGVATRNAMTVVGAAFSPWYFWDGRKDSLWSQALAPLESAVEHGGNRTRFARLIAHDPDYRQQYESLFGDLPALDDGARFPADAGPVEDPVMSAAWEAMHPADRGSVSSVFANLAKSIAAYQRRLLPGPSRFDEYVTGLEGETAAFDTPTEHLSISERSGLRLFVGKGQCVNCHNGPLLTNNEFHNTGSLSAPEQLPSKGRADGVSLAREDPFNCRGPFSDAQADACAELRFAKSGFEVVGAHRTPSLRNVSRTAPYMHAGQLPSLEAVVAQYDTAPLSMVGHNEAKPLLLTAAEREDLVAFLKALDGPIAADAEWLTVPAR